MTALAISLKQHTAERHPEVGGPNQIAVLDKGRVQPIEQPHFPAISAVGFKFQIFSGMNLSGYLKDPGKAAAFYGALAPGCFPLYFRNSFAGVRQELGDAYYSGNVFTESVLSYRGGRVQFERSNQVVDSDLLIGSKIRRDSPEVKQLLRDFKWRSVKSEGEPPRSPSAGVVTQCGFPF